jgi:hypothetical protein
MLNGVSKFGLIWPCLYVLLLAAFVVSLVNPWTRDAQVLIARLLIWPEGKVRVVGMVRTSFPIMQQEFLDAELDDTGLKNTCDKPFVYFLFRSTCEKWPLLETWDGFPLKVVAAVSLTEDTFSLKKSARPPTQYTLQLIKNAQETYPNNGALWVAEARLHFDRSDRRSAAEALKIAAAKPYWGDLVVETNGPVMDALTKETGLYLHDVVKLERRWARLQVAVISDFVIEDLRRAFVDAVKAGDDVAVAEWAGIVKGLHVSARLNGIAERRRFRLILEDASVVETIAARTGNESYKTPGEGTQTWDYGGAQKMVRQFLEERLGTQAAAELFAEVLAPMEVDKPNSIKQLERISLFSGGGFDCRRRCQLAVVLLAGLLAMLVWFVPFGTRVIPAVSFREAALTPGYRAAILCSFAFSTVVLSRMFWEAFERVYHCTGSPSVWPRVLLGCTFSALLGVGANFVWFGIKRRWLLSFMVWLTAAAYLAAIFACAHARFAHFLAMIRV